MKVRIEAVISTAGNNEEYVGKHLGLELLGRPLTRMVVTFEEEFSEADAIALREKVERYESPHPEEKMLNAVIQKLKLGVTAIQIHDIRLHWLS